jgi:hypothetical protein
MKISYRKLADSVGDMILCNKIPEIDEDYGDTLENGSWYPEDYPEGLKEVYQYFLITEGGADFLKRHTDEIVGYSEVLDCYWWGITHWGTPWEGVETDYIEKKEN